MTRVMPLVLIDQIQHRYVLIGIASRVLTRANAPRRRHAENAGGEEQKDQEQSGSDSEGEAK
jgi:hypothetical protein